MKQALAMTLCAGMVSAASAVNLINTDFTSPYVNGNIAGQEGWSDLPLTGGYSFEIDATAGVADTAPYEADFNTGAGTNGHGVVLSPTVGNAIDDEWSGSMDFSLSTSALTGTNIAVFAAAHEIFDIGLSAAPTNQVLANSAGDVTIHLRYQSAGRVQVTLSKPGNNRTLASMDNVELGWDPALQDTNNVSPDFETDKLNLQWTLRKTRTDGTYSAVAVLSNTVSGAVSVYDDVVNDNFVGGKINAYPAAALNLVMQHDRDADDNGTKSLIHIALDSLSVDQTSGNVPTSLDTPVLAASSGNGVVDLSWQTVPEATSYVVERGTTPGGPYSTVVATTNGTSVSDTSVVNDTLYYYIVTAQSAGLSIDSVSAEVVGEPQAAQTGTIMDTSFLASEGYGDVDLAGQDRWKAQANTGTNAFAVTDSAGQGYAVTPEASFDTTLGNGVYYNTLMSNNVLDVWNGTYTFSVKATPTSGLWATNEVSPGVTNQYEVTGLEWGDVLQMGLVAPENVDNAVAFGANGVGLRVRVLGHGALSLRFQNGTEMLQLTRTKLGWDPDWVAPTVNTNGPVFETNEIQLDWTLRKTTSDTYRMSIDAIIGGVTNFGALAVTSEGTGVATSELVMFAMTHNANADRNIETPHAISVNSMSLTKSDNVPPQLLAPDLEGEVVDGTSLELSWTEPVESTSYTLWVRESADGAYTELVTTNGLSFTHAGLVNTRSYLYVVTATYGTHGTSSHSEEIALRPLSQVTVANWGPSAWSSALLRFNFIVADTTTNNIRNRVGNGTGGALLPLSEADYAAIGEPPVYGILQADPTDPANHFAFTRMNNDSTPDDNFIVARTRGAFPASQFIYIELSEDGASAADATGAPHAMEIEFSTFKWSGEIYNGLHAAVRNGSQWYVSESNTDPGNPAAVAGGAKLSIADLALENWVAFTPPTATSTNIATVVGASFGPVSLDNIEAIGYFVDGLKSVGIKSWQLTTGQQPTGLQTWADSYGIYNENAAHDADPDADGISNVHEWGTLGDPTDPGSKGRQIRMLGVDGTGTNLVYVYPRLENEPRPTYTVLDTDNLVHVDFEAATGVVEDGAGLWNTNSPNLGLEAVTNLVPIDVDAKFIGLSITDPDA